MLTTAAAALIAPHLSVAEDRVRSKLAAPPSPELGDVSLPCFTFARELRRSPDRIARELAEKLDGADGVRARADGGYLNLGFASPQWRSRIVAAALRKDYGRSDIGRGRRIVLDMSSPNIAKPFGIGHLRSTVIGNALANLYQAVGYETYKVNHIGDWGTQFGKLIVAFGQWGSREMLEADPIGESLRLYVRFHEEAEREPGLEDEARLAFRALEEGESGSRSLWQYFVGESLKDFARVYDRLDVSFDSFAGESFYFDKTGPVIGRLEALGLLEDSDGAKVVRLEDWQIAPFLALKSDGTTIYAVRDLAAAIYRNEVLGADRIVYVVGAEQSLHFRQLFAVLKKMGHAWASECEHVAFGLMTIDGRKMSTRKGRVVRLEQVLDEAVQAARDLIEEKNPELADKDRAAEWIGVGAVVFGDLKHQRQLSVDFRLDEAVSFEGETGPYVQYTHARICRLLRNAAARSPDASSPPAETDGIRDVGSSPAAGPSWEITGLLARYGAVLQQAAAHHEPYILARYLLELARSCNRLYQARKILNGDLPPGEQRYLLSLLSAAAGLLRDGLGLLGVRAPEEM